MLPARRSFVCDLQSVMHDEHKVSQAHAIFTQQAQLTLCACKAYEKHSHGMVWTRVAYKLHVSLESHSMQVLHCVGTVLWSLVVDRRAACCIMHSA